ALEQKASAPATLAALFPLDHLTTRMRRHAEGLIILSGAAPGRSWSEPVPVVDIIRGAVAEVEDYKRVTVLTKAEDAVAGLAAADMIHLLAELIENATLSSPSGTRVEVRAERVANGFAIEIADRGRGSEVDQLHTINKQLAQPPDFDLANADQLGLFVVGKLAARHGVRVALRPSPYGGTTAVALMPNSIVVPLNEAEADTHPDLRPPSGRPPGLDPRLADAFVLTGRQSAQPTLPRASAGAARPADGSSGPALVSAGAAPGSASAALSPPGSAPGWPAPPRGRSGPVPAQPGPPPARQRGFASGQPGSGPGPSAPGRPGSGPGPSAHGQPASAPGPSAPGQPVFGPGPSAPGQDTAARGPGLARAAAGPPRAAAAPPARRPHPGRPPPGPQAS